MEEREGEAIAGADGGRGKRGEPLDLERRRRAQALRRRGEARGVHPRKYAVVVLLLRCVLPNATPKKNHDNKDAILRTYA